METEINLAHSIASKNDDLRRQIPHLPYPHKCVLTDEIAALPENELMEVIEKVKVYSEFQSENDPHSEHDFGSFSFKDETIFWKFDYYDKDLKYFEENGVRILTIMFAHEY
jgi:hypothetical protein